MSWRWPMRRGLMLQLIHPSSLTAWWPAMPDELICCSWPVRCNPSPVLMWAAASGTRNLPTYAGSPAPPAMSPPIIISAAWDNEKKLLFCPVGNAGRVVSPQRCNAHGPSRCPLRRYWRHDHDGFVAGDLQNV